MQITTPSIAPNSMKSSKKQIEVKTSQSDLSLSLFNSLTQLFLNESNKF